MGLEDGRVLDDIADDRPAVSGGADDDQRLRRQVDVLLVLHVVRGDGLITKFAELDADFIRGGLVGAAAHGGPIGLGDRQTLGRGGDGILHGDDPAHFLGQRQQLAQFMGNKGLVASFF